MEASAPRSALENWKAFAKALDKQCAALAYVYTQDTDLPQIESEGKEVKLCSFDANACLLNDPSKTASGRDASPDERQLVLRHWMSLGGILGALNIVVVQNLESAERVTVLLGLLGQGTPTDCSWSYVTSETAVDKRFHAIFVRSPLKISRYSTWAFADGMFFDHAPLQALISTTSHDLFSVSATSLSTDERKVFFDGYDERVVTEFNVSGLKDAKKKKKSAIHVISGRFLEDSQDFLLQAPVEAVDNVLVDVKTLRKTPHECSALKLVSKPEETADFGLNDAFPLVLSLEI